MTDFQPLVLETNLTPADYAAYLRVWTERARARVGRARVAGATLLPLLVAGALAHQLGDGLSTRSLMAFLFGACGAMLGTTAAAGLYRRFAAPGRDGVLLGPRRVELADDGLRVRRRDLTSFTSWSVLQDVTRTETHVFLWIDRQSAFILPVRDLPPEVNADDVERIARAYAAASAPTGEAPLDSPPPPAIGARATGAGFVSTLLRRLSWRPVPSSPLASSDAMILTGAGAALAVWLAFDRYRAGADPEWYLGGIVGITWYAAGVLALAFALHRASAPKAGLRDQIAALVGGLPLPLALALAVDTWAPAAFRGPAFVLIGVAVVLYVRRTLAWSRATRPALALLAGSLLCALFAWGTVQSWVYPHVWYADHDDDQDAGDGWAERERLLFEQADRIDLDAARLGVGAPGRPDVFFVGFAGYGDQKVFAEEIKLSERVVAERYDAEDRTLLLVNDDRDRDTWPLATVSGLRRALRRVAEHMDLDDDVLFLMLTSHGSDDPEISVSNGSWPLEQLDGAALRSALDDSGIKWRVVVISACHSGAFIEPVATENTIVLTSAAGDRTSFGCSDESEITYFGAALMRDALPGAASLAAAFEAARVAVAERERREGIDASKPESYFGGAIQRHWERVEAARQEMRSARAR